MLYKRIWLFILFIWFVSFSKVYKLDDIVEKALNNSEALKNIELQMYKAESQVQEAYGNALPSLIANVNYNHTFKSYSPSSNYSFSDILSYSGVDTLSERGSYVIANSLNNVLSKLGQPKENAATMGLTFEQPIFAQGKVRIGLKIANTYRSTLNCKVEDEKIKLRGAITKLFYNSLLIQKNVQIAGDAVKLAEETHEMTIMRQSIGQASELDTLTSRLLLKNAQIDFNNAISAQNIVYTTLMSNAGISEPLSTFGVDGILPEAEFNYTLDQVLEKVKNQNFTVTQLKGNEEIQNQYIKLAKADLYPYVFGGITVGKVGQFENQNDFSSGWGTDEKVYIGANWNIFTGLKRNQKIAQAQYDLEIFLRNKKQLMDDLELRARNIYETISTDKEHLIASGELITLAEKNYSIAKKAYEFGSKTLLDVQNAELELNKAKRMNNEILFSFHSALIDLKLLMGTFN